MLNPKRRIGRFNISEEVLSYLPDELYLLFSKIIILRVNSLIEQDVIEYVAHSEMFEESKPYEIAPLYQIYWDKEYRYFKAEKIEENQAIYSDQIPYLIDRNNIFKKNANTKTKTD